MLSATTILVSDGHGLMYILRLNDPGRTADAVRTYRLPNGVPFRLHDAIVVTEDCAMVVLSFHFEDRDGQRSGSSGKAGAKRTSFNVWAVKINLSIPQSQIEELEIVWQRQGDSVPIYTAHHPQSRSYLLIGGSVYNEVDASRPAPYEPTPDEIAPIPRLDENLDTKLLDAFHPPPYSWTQTSDSVTIAFPLPSSTPKSQILVSFTSTSLSLDVKHDITTSLPMPAYNAKALWDGISPSTSYWTWDREAAHTFGLLSIHLDKKHEGTKWMQVFAKSAEVVGTEFHPEDAEVPETIDPSELYKIRESLEKYTAALKDGDDASGLGLGKGLPSLAENEMDEEIDNSVGRTAYVTWVGPDGQLPAWSKSTATVPIQLLSIPLPGTATFSPPSVIIKNNVDGTEFSLPKELSSPEVPLIWAHTSTFSALAFVLASKRDTRFIYHTANGVFAFENGTRDRGGNVYIYRSCPVTENWAKQAILKVADGEGGNLLGAGAVTVAGQTLIVGLTETELVLIRIV